MKTLAQHYLELGERIAEARLVFGIRTDEGGLDLTDEDKTELRDVLTKLREICGQMPLPVSWELLRSQLKTLPTTWREFDILIQAVKAEMQSILFLRVPSEKVLYYEHTGILKPQAREAFPTAYIELQKAGTAYALGLDTASVFHSMRAAEIGVRGLAKKLKVTFPFPLELADWANVLDQIESKILAMKNLRKSKKKDDDLKFYSEAAAQFRYFKDAWRVRASHVRENFESDRALSILTHTTEFFEGLSSRLGEPKKKSGS